ncbi:hypothetical protein D9613_010091 [Agrocybe pediades]|uniref:DUF7729 domain-containing protein n=1 Tax=Agrocybe pediades TaxID=84607 RepID=A0A8H4VSD7_9AGAR|nr:hypothetical protein D9613_010091 [Agrocybe pediades]
MFTPPPSPVPPRNSDLPRSESPPPLDLNEKEDMLPQESPEEMKRRAGRRLRLAVLLVPLLVILFSLYQTYLANRVSELSTTQPLSHSWHGLVRDEHGPKLHKRQSSSNSQVSNSSGSQSSSSSSTSSTPTRVADQPLPTVPSAPPVLPTPFPQSLVDLGQNFTSPSCAAFFTNMTGSAPFRSCRPFSLLLGSSPDFINAQSNLTLMNSLIWGTCNTNTAYSQCQSNMAWFASSLKDNCAKELDADYTLAVETLQGLNAFSVMHDAACLTSPGTNSYCYVNAVRNSNPADLYYYQLPLGIGIPKVSTSLTCSQCSVSVMRVYASALTDLSTAPLLTGLKSTYDDAASYSAQVCGANFAQASFSSGAAAGHLKRRTSWTSSVTSVGMFAAAWTVLRYLS